MQIYTIYMCESMEQKPKIKVIKICSNLVNRENLPLLQYRLYLIRRPVLSMKPKWNKAAITLQSKLNAKLIAAEMPTM